MARARRRGEGGRGGVACQSARAATAAAVTRATMQTASKDVDARALCADAANAVRVWPRAARSAAAPLPAWARLVKKKNAQARARARCGRAQGRAQRESVRERVLERRGSQEADVCHPRLRRSQRALTAALLSSRWRARARARARSRRFPHNCKLPKSPAMRL